ncbi:aldehyde dehydrogenase (NAD+) [Kineococcus xinjiangensis]|uniref:aldehyde dehydrogenase (NAD(+)) n=1 Tax=Kineococcus xinjiangensis TaxID=512762 RepID=A0A2S6ID36_9ACTN|nr:aldehyde dehydrogenase family protein [Kineococcus xinjiangensis]PPK92107.1 aldehyde dehydrogenase (NAD+) [Kineococcus xinjiangensis]
MTTTSDRPTTAAAPVPGQEALRETALRALRACGVAEEALRVADGAASLSAVTCLTGAELLRVPAVGADDVEGVVDAAHEAFTTWRTTPAPVRGGLVKRLGQLLSEHKEVLADLVTLEAGKIRSEALGEVQEMIDVCDYAVGISRQLYGKTMPSERPGHRLMETWHPLGVVGVISAFNFPVAVWSWNSAIALVCGDSVVWKPSEKTPLTALACSALLDRAIAETGAPAGLHGLLLGGREVGEALVDSPRVPLVSATGSTRMGREVGPRVAARFGRSLLELGGNNAAVVTASADLELATRAIVFSAAGTAGQRCTTLRRLIVHSSVVEPLLERLVAAYGRLPIGSPLEQGTLVGPLVDAGSHQRFTEALERAREAGGEVLVGGGRRDVEGAEDGYYVEPAIVRMPAQTDVVREETFAPILYVLTYDTLDEAIELHNGVPQGLSSGIFTADQREAERFIAADGSDCGIVNVNIGTSGAEIGGAFGGEKETGGGRESGSDSWQAYMRRATNTVNYSGELLLAQDVNFL